MSNNDDDTNHKKKVMKNKTENNLITIVLFALAFAAALGLNDLIGTIFKKFSHGSQIVSKIIYVTLMFVAVLVLAYYTHSTVTLA